MYWIMSILGLLLLIAPFGFGLSTNSIGLWACLILGMVVTISAGIKAITNDFGRWESVVVLIAGIVAVITPFILGFSSNAGGMWASSFLGLGMILFAGKDIFEKRPR